MLFRTVGEVSKMYHYTTISLSRTDIKMISETTAKAVHTQSVTRFEGLMHILKKGRNGEYVCFQVYLRNDLLTNNVAQVISCLLS